MEQTVSQTVSQKILHRPQSPERLYTMDYIPVEVMRLILFDGKLAYIYNQYLRGDFTAEQAIIKMLETLVADKKRLGKLLSQASNLSEILANETDTA